MKPISYLTLLEKTQQIAEAVNRFDDVRIQRAAFVVLMEALGVEVDEQQLTERDDED